VGELHERLSAIEKKIVDFSKVVDIPLKEQQISRLESRMAEGDFWTDQSRAQKQVAELKAIKAVVERHSHSCGSERGARTPGNCV